MANYSDLFPRGTGGATIAAIHRGVITMAGGSSTATATIPSVDLTKSFVRFNGDGAQNTNSGGTSSAATLSLTSSTTVEAVRQSSSNDFLIGYEVVEYASGVAQVIQQEIDYTTSSLSFTKTLDGSASVDPTKTEIIYGGQRITNGTQVFTSPAGVYLLNATTLQCEKRNGNSQAIARVTVVEFK